MGAFPLLVLGMAALPIFFPGIWGRRWFQALFVAVCAVPVVVQLGSTGHGEKLFHSVKEYVAFITTLGALFVTTGGIYATGDLEATPRTNVLILLAGAVLASVIGTTGASMLVIRPLLRTNSQREFRAHLVPFFIILVSNAGGLLTPLGDPPLLVGFISGVPFFWTLRLFPVWALYVGSILGIFYYVEKRAYARENATSLARDRREVTRLQVQGKWGMLWLMAIVAAAFLDSGWRDVAMLGIALCSYFSTKREVHELNEFSFHPILEVALLFVGLFICLVPIEMNLATVASQLPIQKGWQLFWSSGSLSAVLDNAPTYAAFFTLAKSLNAGRLDLIAGVTPVQLIAISAGSVVMGATTYIGNGPNLMVKAVAEKSKYVMPSFARYAVFAFFAMLPAHLIVTMALLYFEN
jgi:Na+/H+ antiporter NhaD/arsenite permease-like protein